MTDYELIKSTPLDELKKNHLRAVFEVYLKLFGEVCSGCPSKITGYINRIKKHKKTTAMSELKSKKYLLKTGKIIVVKGSSNAFSNKNLTDEQALSFLKKNPNRKILFSKMPDNVDELIEAKEELSAADILAKKTRKKLNNIALGLSIDSKDFSNRKELAEAIIETQKKAEYLENSEEE